MKIAIVGAGWTGLTAAYRLLQCGHSVVIIEQAPACGGLAGSFQKDNWQWPLEKFYHHWFTNDSDAITLANELNQKVLTFSPKTDVLRAGKIYAFDTPKAILTTPILSALAKLRMIMVVIYLKLLRGSDGIADKTALDWLRRYMGNEATEVIWEPLLRGKFGKWADVVSVSWFYARIKKRTQKLAYPSGGFASMSDKLVTTIENLGGEIYLNERVEKISSNKSGKWLIHSQSGVLKADALLLTIPSWIVPKILPTLPKKLVKKMQSINHLSAQVLVLELAKPMLKGTYWLNITEPNFPYLAVVEHTNMLSKTHYGGNHVVYIGNYLPPDHEYLLLSAEQLLELFSPTLEKIAPGFKKNIISFTKWQLPDAQHVVDTNYLNKIPPYKLPLNGAYLANLDMIYPWDRGTNYAIAEGDKVAKLIVQDFLNRM